MFRSNETNSSGAFRWKKPPSVRVDGNWCTEYDKDNILTFIVYYDVVRNLPVSCTSKVATAFSRVTAH